MSIHQLTQKAVRNIQPASVDAGAVQDDAPLSAQPGDNAAALDSALTALLQYIPTEATAIYLAIVSALPAIQKGGVTVDGKLMYWICLLGIVPALFVLLYINQLAAKGLKLPPLAQLPWFRLLASMIAFGVWALCIPGNPFVPADKPAYGVIWSVVAIIVSVFLPLIETAYNYFFPPPSPPPAPKPENIS